MNLGSDLSKASVEDLLCHAFRHRWVPRAANVGKVIRGARTWDWELSCKTGCGSRATEWRDNYGVRIPGTHRQYYPTDSYKECGGYTQGDYIMELHRRGIYKLGGSHD